MKNIYILFLIAVLAKVESVENSKYVRPRSRLKKGEGVLIGIIIGILIGIVISILINHFVFIVIGLAFGHYIGLSIEVLACPSTTKEILSYRKYSFIVTMVAIASIIYLAFTN